MTPKPRKKQDKIVIPKPCVKRLTKDDKYWLITGWILGDANISIDKLRVKIDDELNRGDGIYFEVHRALITELMPKASKGGK